MLSLISVQVGSHTYEFDCINIEILDRGSSKATKEFTGAWRTKQLAISRHTDIDLIYRSIRRRSINHKFRHQLTKTTNLNSWTNEDNKLIRDNRSQTLIEQLRSSFLHKAGTEQVFQNNNKRSKNTTPPKTFNTILIITKTMVFQVMEVI